MSSEHNILPFLQRITR